MGRIVSEESQEPVANPQAAWYIDPSQPDQIRYWDGRRWTEHVAPLDTVADMHTGHFEAVRTEGRGRLGLADGPPRSNHNSVAAESAIEGPHFEIEPPELGRGWFVAEGLTLQPDGIRTEHVVVGSPGVFVLMSRDHSNSDVWVADRSFLVDGQSTNYLRQASRTAQALTRMLREQCGFTVGVEPVIIVKAKELTIKSQPLDAQVLSAPLLGKWLIRLEPILLPSAVRAVSEAVGAHKSQRDLPGYPSIDDDSVIDLTDDTKRTPRTFSSVGDDSGSQRTGRRSLFS